MTEKKMYRMEFKQLSLSAVSHVPSGAGVEIIVDGNNITKNGVGITTITFKGKSNKEPQLFIEGDITQMDSAVTQMLVNV